jgi:hypothetical protein
VATAPNGGPVELVALPDGFIAMPPPPFGRAVRRYVLDAGADAVGAGPTP